MKGLKKITVMFIPVFVLAYSIITSNTVSVIERNDYLWSSSSFEQYSSIFVNASKEFGVPASLLMALAVEETGFGEAGVAKQNNWFGMTKGSLYPTPANCNGNFECYASVEDSIRDAARLLGSPTASYKLTNIIISNGGLDGSYDQLARAITAHWCTSGCTYDADDLLDLIQKYNLTKYDSGLSSMSVEDLKAILEKFYGKNAVKIPGYDDENKGWDGKFDAPIIEDNEYNAIYFNTSYSGDITQGYIYKKYNDPEDPNDIWTNSSDETDEGRVNIIISNIFLQGEKLYGDGILHISDFQFEGTSNEAPLDIISGGSYTDGTPLSCYTMISSSFGSQESFRTAKHKGMDLAAPAGTSIHSVTDGTVVQASGGCPAVGYYGNTCGGGYGNFVKVKASDGTMFIYAHMYTTPAVRTGQTVTKGQQLGVVGSSGSSTGNHLHFEVRDKNNNKINPTPYSNYQNIPKC